MVICKAPLTGGYSEAFSAWQAGENKSSNYGETQMNEMISPVTVYYAICCDVHRSLSPCTHSGCLSDCRIVSVSVYLCV